MATKGKKKAQRTETSDDESDDQHESVDIIKKRHGYSNLASNDDLELYEPLKSDVNSSVDFVETSTLSKIQEELQCATCHDLLFEPVLLACGHSFCRPCLKNAFLFAADQLDGMGVRRCLSCRANLCGCTLKLPISYVLWNTIKLLFPSEVSIRTREVMAEVAELRRSCKGENGGAHNQGNEIVIGIQKNRNDWIKLDRKNFKAIATRSIVLDDKDQCRHIALSYNLKIQNEGETKKRSYIRLDDIVIVTVAILNCEEDESSELPIIFKTANDVKIDETGDDCLLLKTHSDHSLEVSVTSTDFLWTREVMINNGLANFCLHFGNEPVEHIVTIIDQQTKAELKFILPVAPCGWRKHTEEEDEDDDDDDESSSQEEDLDEYEDDGFLVNEDEEDEGEISISDDDDDDDKNHEANVTPEINAVEICDLCGGSTVDSHDQVLICDRCDVEAHLSCTGLDEVPEGDWFCETCTAVRQHEQNEEAEEEEEESFDSPLPLQNRKAKRPRLLSDSDSE